MKRGAIDPRDRAPPARPQTPAPHHASNSYRNRNYKSPTSTNRAPPLLVALILLCLSSHPSLAQTVGSSCTGAATGSTFMTGANPAYILYCTNSSGGTWQSSIELTDTGLVGIGETGSQPVAALDVNGGLRIGNDTASCSSTNAGEIIYTGTVLEYCGNPSGSYVWGTPAGTSSSGTLGGVSGVLVELTAGSAGAPSLTFYADTTTGLYQPSTHTMAVTTAGTESAAFDASGNLNLVSSTAAYEINSNKVLVLVAADPTGSLAVGASALSSGSLSGTDNIGVGGSALAHTTSGSNNTALGYVAGEFITTGSSNVAIGVLSDGFNGVAATGSDNVAVGYEALYSATSANNDVAIGYQAMYDSTSVLDATAIGSQALFSAVGSGTGQYNTAIGYAALYSNTTTPDTAIGYQALQYGSTNSSTAVGYDAMQGVSVTPLAGNQNTALGDSALALIQGASGQDTAIGASALQYMAVASQNTAVGYQAMQSVSGANALTGTDNTAVGANAMAATQTTAASNTAIGASALSSNTTGIDLTAIGYQAMQYAGAAASGGVAVGYNAMQGVSGNGYAGSSTVAVGNSALMSIANGGDSDLAIGYQAAEYLTTGEFDTAIGYQAMTGASATPLTSATGANTAIGYQALTAIQGATIEDTAIGAGALAGLTTGAGDTAAGFQAGQYVTTGGSDTAIGTEAMMGLSATPLTSSTGENTAVGDSALLILQGTAAQNTAVGYQAGDSITTGGSNTLLGYQAGSSVTGSSNIIIGEGGNITSGSSNILIGNSLTGTTAGSNSQLDIGDLIRGALGGTNYISIDSNQHMNFHGSSPTQSSTNCGNASFAVVGNDNAFQVTTGTTASTTCVINFANSFTNTPLCVVTPKTAETVNISAASTSSITITHSTSAASAVYYVQCSGYLRPASSMTRALPLNTALSRLLGTPEPEVRRGALGLQCQMLRLPGLAVLFLLLAGFNTPALAIGIIGGGGIPSPCSTFGISAGKAAFGDLNNPSYVEIGYGVYVCASTGNTLYSAIVFGPTGNVGMSYNNAGNVVSNTNLTLPVSKLDVSGINTTATGITAGAGYYSGTTPGGVRITYDTSYTTNSCSSTNAGEIVYTGSNSPAGSLQYCNGTAWGDFPANGSGTLGGSSPGVLIELESGTAAAPSLTFNADTTTGLYYPSSPAHTMAVTTAGTERAVFDASGNLSLTSGAYEVGSVPFLSSPSGDSSQTSLGLGSNALGGASLTGQHNTGTGYYALHAITSGSSDTAAGYEAMQYATQANDSTGIGYQSMQGISATPATGSNNTAIGAQSLAQVTTGANNTAMGYDALYETTTGTGNTAAGTTALYSNVTGSDSTAVGYDALYTSTAGPNTAAGYYALEAATSGTQNTAIGYQALDSVTTTSANTAIGSIALSGTTGSGNTGAGYSSSGTGSYNVSIGADSGDGGSYNTVVGMDAFTVGTSSYNVVVGTFALEDNTSGNYNIAIGRSSQHYTGTGSSNIAFGAVAMEGSSTTPLGGSNNISLSTSQGFMQSTATGNIAAIINATAALTTGSYNIAFGQGALLDLTTGNYNTAVGEHALETITTSSDNTAIGNTSLIGASAGPNTAIGYLAGEQTTGTNNTAMGWEALKGSSTNTSSYNTAIGDQALLDVTGAANHNTAVGYKAAGATALAASSDNSLFGWEAGVTVQSANSNIIVGEVGNITSGASNILIGNSLSGTTATSSSQLDIGDLVRGTVGGSNYYINIDGNQHTNFHGSSPTQSSTNCGNASFALVGNDNAFQVTTGTTAATTCVINFANSWTNTPICEVTPQTAETVNISAASTSSITITHSVSAAAAVYYVRCRGYL